MLTPPVRVVVGPSPLGVSGGAGLVLPTVPQATLPGQEQSPSDEAQDLRLSGDHPRLDGEMVVVPRRPSAWTSNILYK